MKVQDVPKSGKRGNVVAYKSRLYGQIERQHVVPKKWPTAAQSGAAGDFGRASFGWGSLTEEQRAAWCAAAKQTRVNPRGERCKGLTGQTLYTSITRHQSVLGLPPFAWPPERPPLDFCSEAAFRITRAGDAIALKLSLPEPVGGHLLLFGSRGYSPGRGYCDKFIYIGALAAPVAGEIDITELYLARLGAPQLGFRIFLRAVQQVNGWRGLPMQTSGLVPAG